MSHTHSVGTSLHSLISAREASPNYGACTGRSSESNAASGDCSGGSSKVRTTNRSSSLEPFYSVVWHVSRWNQLQWCHRLDFHQILTRVQVETVKMEWGIYSTRATKNASWGRCARAIRQPTSHYHVHV